jgi:hypothetical protein
VLIVKRTCQFIDFKSKTKVTINFFIDCIKYVLEHGSIKKGKSLSISHKLNKTNKVDAFQMFLAPQLLNK